MSQYATLDQARETCYLDPGLRTRVRNAIVFVGLVAWIGCAVGALMDPHRFYPSYLTGFLFPVAIGVGALFFTMVQHLTGSVWSLTVRRILETMAATLPVTALTFIPVALGLHHLYSWSHADVVAKDAILQGKAVWLNPTAFTVRGFVYIAIWSLLSIALYRNSVRQDRTHSIEQIRANAKWSAPGMLLAFLTVSLAAFDWIMSLDPHWYSTMFGVYFFAGGGLAAMSLLALICLWLRQSGILENSITVEHYHDIGKWMFALTVFWAYIAFSQYMLIWYANLPEETGFFINRTRGGWGAISLILLFGHFIIPFLVLLNRASKRNLKLLMGAAIWILAIEYLDLYWLVMPQFSPAAPAPHWLDAACLVAPVSLYALVFWTQLGKHSLVCEGDLRLEQALVHHQV